MDVDALMQWAAMGRHGFYVWLAWGVTLLVLVTLVLHARIDSLRLRGELEMDLELRERETAARKGDPGQANPPATGARGRDGASGATSDAHPGRQ